MEELWKDIPDYEGLYQVSDLGSVKSLNYNNTKKERLRVLTVGKDGYLYIVLSKKSKHKTYKVHQLVAMAFLGHIPCGYKTVINHININRLDNRLVNLELVSARTNSNKIHIKSTSEYVGVVWHKRDKKWYASIVHNTKTIHLGTFDCELEASEYYEQALVAINRGEEIKCKPNNFTSPHRGVHKPKNNKKWIAKIRVEGDLVHIGSFLTEEEAVDAYNKYKESTPTPNES